MESITGVLLSPSVGRGDDSEQQAAIERNIQATRRVIDAGRDQPPHELARVRELAQLDAGSMRAVDARGERGAAAVDLVHGEAHAPIGASAVMVRADEIPRGAVLAAGPAEPAGSSSARVASGATDALPSGVAAGMPPPSLVATALVAPNSLDQVASSRVASSHVASSSVGLAAQSHVGQLPVGPNHLAQSSPPPTPSGAGAALTPAGGGLLTTDMAGLVGPNIPPASADALAEAQVARRAAAIAAAYRAFGEVDAAREVRMRTRELPPELAGEVMAAARTTLEGIVSTFGRAQGASERADRIERIERWDGTTVRPDASAGEPQLARSTRYEHVATDLAAAMEHVGRAPRGEVVTRDIASLILDAVERGDEYRLSAFALGVPFGTGLTLPLALGEELERRRDRRRQQLLRLAMEQGLKRLQQRIAATVGALIALARPLGDFLAIRARGDASDRDLLLQLLRDYADREAHFLSELTDCLRRVDAVGNDVFFVLDALRRQSTTTAALQASRSDLLASPATAFAIAHSASALDAALQRARTNSRQREDERSLASVIQAAQRLYTELGFSKARSSLLAQATFAHSELPLAAQWMVLNSAEDLDQRSSQFEALLRFFGAAATPRQIRSVELSDAEDEKLDRPVWGLELYRSLEQVN